MEQVLAFGIGQAVEERKPTLPQMRERFAAMAKQHQSSLLRIASNFCRGDLHAAQDLMQEALVNGYRAYLGGGFSDGSNGKAWLARILTNVFLNDYRRRKKHQAPVELEEDIASDEGQAADREVLQSVLDEPLQNALQRLPEQQRFCVLLVDLEGLDYAEAAQVLNCPVGTIRSRLARARAALYDDLFEYAKDRGAV